MKQPTLSEINDLYQDFQDELLTKEKKLRILPTFKEEEELDQLISLIDLPRKDPKKPTW